MDPRITRIVFARLHAFGLLTGESGCDWRIDMHTAGFWKGVQRAKGFVRWRDKGGACWDM